MKKCISVMLAAVILLSALTALGGVGTLKAEAASWNGTNYGGGSLYGYRTFLEAYGIDYDVYMKWLDDHDADSPNPKYYLGTPYAHGDHRNPRGDCQGAYGYYDTAGVAAMNCTGFVWHVLYKSAVNSGAYTSQINELSVMAGVPQSWARNGVYRIYFDTIEDAYNSGALEKGDLMWIYGSSDNHNAIFYGDSPEDFIYWDSAGERNRYCEVHSIGACRGLWVAKVTQPDVIELHAKSGYRGTDAFGAKYSVFNSKADAQAAVKNRSDTAAWDKRLGTIALDNGGCGYLRTASAPTADELWAADGKPQTNLSYFRASASRVSGRNNYYAVQWSTAKGGKTDNNIYQFKDSGRRTPTGYRIFMIKPLKSVDTPEITSMKSTGDGIKISWNAVKNADKYRVYYKNRFGGWTRLTETAATSFVDEKVNVGSTFIYTVRCVDNDGEFISDFDHAGRKYTYKPLDTPVITSTETTDEGVLLKWDAVEGASQYRAYYRNRKGGWTRMTQTAGTEYLDTDFKKGDTYTYTVRCVDEDGDFASDFNRSGWQHTIYCDTPMITDAQSVLSGVKLSWEPVEGAYQYRVYYLSKTNGWTRMGATSSASFVDKDVASGSEYTYTVRCVDKEGRFTSDFDRQGVTCTFVSAPVVKDIHTADGGVSLSWDAVNGAYGYRVFVRENGEWKRLGTTEQTSFLDTRAESGERYTYTVRCVGEDDSYVSDRSSADTSCTYIAAPEVTRFTAGNSGLTLNWEPVRGAYRYRVFKNGKDGWERLGVTGSTSFTDTSVKPGETAVYTVRCMDQNEKYISDYHRDGFSATYVADIDFALSSEADGVRLSWEPVEGVAAYRVFYQSEKDWERLGATEETEFLDASITDGENRVYTLRGLDADGNYVTGFLRDGKRIAYTIPDESV